MSPGRAGKEFSTPIRVYIEDTDAGGIVYYVNYLKYFERARTEFMRARGFDKPAFMDGTAMEGTAGGDSAGEMMFVVTDAQIKYRVPAKLDDALLATAEVAELGAATLVFDQKVLRNDVVLVEGKVTIALVGVNDGRPKRLPKGLRAAVAG